MGRKGLIRRLAPDLSADEARGVEAHLRQRYGSLESVPSRLLGREVRLALQCEELNPGYLNRCRKNGERED